MSFLKVTVWTSIVLRRLTMSPSCIFYIFNPCSLVPGGKTRKMRWSKRHDEVFCVSVFQKYPLQELQCPLGLQEEDFLDLLRSTFPQLGADKPFDVFTTDHTRKLQPLRVETLTPEQIYRSIRSSGHSALYIRLQVHCTSLYQLNKFLFNLLYCIVKFWKSR